MKNIFSLLPALIFCAALHGQEAYFPPLPDSCFDIFVFHLPKSQTDAAKKKFTHKLDSLLAVPHPDPLALAIVHRRLAVVNLILTRQQPSKSHAFASLRLIEQQAPVPEAERSKSLHVCANLLMLSGQYDSVLLLIDTAMALNRRLYGKISPALGANYKLLGIAYMNIGQFSKAATFLDEAVEIERQVYTAPHPWFARTLCARALNYDNLAKPDLAIQDSQEAENIIIKTLGHPHPALGNIYQGWGIAFQIKGDFEKGLIFSKRALAIRESLLGANHREVGYNCTIIGDLYMELGDLENATHYHERGYAISTESAGGTPPSNIAAHMVALYAITGDFRKEQAAFEVVEASGWGKETAWGAMAYISHASVLFQQNRPAEALIWLDKAEQINHKVNPDDPRQNHGALQLKADVLTHLQRFDEAIVTYKNVLTSPIAKSKKQAQIGLARIFRERYQREGMPTDLDSAWLYDLAAIRTLDSMRFSYESSTSRIQQSEMNFQLFEDALGVSVQKQDTVSAFWIAEKSKAQVLLENHRDDLARHLADLPDSLLHRETTLKSQIADLEKTAYEAPPGDTRQAAEAVLFEKKQGLNALLQTLEKDYPAYFRLKYLTALAGAADVQNRLLDPATALLEYFVGDSTIYVFILTKDQLQLTHLRKPASFETVVKDLRTALTDSELRFLKKDINGFAASSGQLYDWLLADPLAALPPTIEHLIIVPDGALNYLPFDILGKNEGLANFKNYPYLLKKFSVSYAASANLLLEQTGNSQSTTALGLFAGFAPVYADGDTFNRMTSPLRVQLVREGKYHLPGATREVEEIAALLNGKTWLGPTATKQQFQQQSSQFRIVHLAMHSVLNDANPLFSKLLFTQCVDSLQDNDLHANELYNMHLPARLVVLSACNTGVGQLRRGEGIMSLARAFTFAGVPATVISLWPAPDEATRQLMVGFYAGLKKGLFKDEALRQAKLAYLSACPETLASPFFWAGFVANGNMEALFERK